MATLDLTGLKYVQRGMKKMSILDATPLMYSWEKIIEEDNRKGVLAGTDRYGGYMLAVTYRPVPDRSWQSKVRSAKDQKAVERARLRRQRLNQGGRVGAFAGFGAWVSGLHNNLTSAEYRRLSGPPLAPRKGFSRVITNLVTGHGRDGRTWYAVGAWADVVSTKGVPFLIAHFEGMGRLPMRDLRGVRPEGVKRAGVAMNNWIRLLFREAFP